MQWLLSIDVGTNSLGWWAYLLKKDTNSLSIQKSIGGGVRLFPDGRESSTLGRVGDSLAVERRKARGARRNREHRKLRRKRLEKVLLREGLLPEDQQTRKLLFQTSSKEQGDSDLYNPYRLRAKAVEKALKPYELGRALFHLGVRRGYKSNRKQASEEEGGKLKEKMDQLSEKLAGRTLGQYFWCTYCQEQEKSNRYGAGDRPHSIRFSDQNPFHASRDFYKDEFNRIQKKQMPYHTLSKKTWDKIGIYILEQRPLKPVERGCCELFPEKKRYWKDTPVGHTFRVYQEVNNLRIIKQSLTEHRLNPEQREAILNKLMSQQSCSFKTLRKLKDSAKNLLFPIGSHFNLESPKRKKLDGHKIAALFKKNPLFAPLWKQYSETGQLDNIFEILFETEDNTSAITALQKEFSLTEEVAKALTSLKLGRMTGRLSRKAMTELVPFLREGKEYWEAVGKLKDDKGQPLHHSHRLGGKRYQYLPYYGKVMPKKMLGAHPEAKEAENPEYYFGRINNPNVHVALNQLKLLVNTLITHFACAPTQIHIEVTRSLKQGKKKREEIEKEQAKNQKENKKIEERLKETPEFKFQKVSSRDIRKYKLWEELGEDSLNRSCPFSGKNISASQLFNGEVEIEHILPFSRTLDNSFSNLTLAFREINRVKGNQTPYEAFSGTDKYEGILERIKNFPNSKKNRFGENAMKHYKESSGFISRQLTDTAYMSRLTGEYLECLEGVEKVLTLPGYLTAIVRGKWGLNRILGQNTKTREDHRHHAIDAAVIGLINRSLLQKISKENTKTESQDRLKVHIPELAPSLRKAIEEQVGEILPSYKPDHSLTGKIFKETAYGSYPEENNGVARKAVNTLTENEIESVLDQEIREALKRKCNALEEKEKSKRKKALKQALNRFSEEFGIRRIRLAVEDQTMTIIPSARYKSYIPDSYICCDIWRLPPQKRGGKAKYEGVFWTYYEVKRTSDGQKILDKNGKKPHPAARYITRVFKNDLIETGPVGKGAVKEGTILKIAGFSTTNNGLDIRHPYEAQSKQNYKSINILARAGLRRLHITPDGRVLRKRVDK